MGRLKAKSGSVSWTLTPHVLSDSAEKELLTLLGFNLKSSDSEDAGKKVEAMKRVEFWLGSYFGEKIARKNIPTPAHYSANLKPIREDAENLKEKLKNLHEWMQVDLNAYHADLHHVTDHLTGLLGAINAVQMKYQGVDSRGWQNKDMAMLKLIHELRLIFTKYSRREKSEWKKGSIYGQLSETDLIIRFITQALDDAKIKVPPSIPTVFDELDLVPKTREEILEKYEEFQKLQSTNNTKSSQINKDNIKNKLTYF